MKDVKSFQLNREEREALVKVVQEKIRNFMRKHALTDSQMYKNVGIAYSTFKNILRYPTGNALLPRIDVLYKVDNYIERAEFLKYHG